MNVSDELILLVKKAIRGEKTDKRYSQEEIKQILDLADKHEIANIASDILWKSGLGGDGEQGKRILQYQLVALYRRETLDEACRQISVGFSKERIQHVFLKGAVTKKLYPEAIMRMSCDIDILVHADDMARAEAILKRIGFTAGKVSVHEHEFHNSKKKLTVELHSMLMSGTALPETVKMLDRVWEYVAFGDDGYSGALTDAMMYFYHIAHMAKHFRNGGCGIRSLLDLYLMKNTENADVSKRNELVVRGDLSVFAQNSEKLADIWFGGEGMNDELTAQMADYIISGGVHGCENVYLAKSTNVGNKNKYICEMIFASFGSMKRMYPILKKYPFLLPFCHVMRFFRVIFKGKKTVDKLKCLNDIKDSDMQAVSKMFEKLNISKK